MNLNLNLYLGMATIVGVGVLATQGWLGDEWARTALAFVLGGAATYGGKEWQARRPTPPPESEPPEINALR